MKEFICVGDDFIAVLDVLGQNTDLTPSNRVWCDFCSYDNRDKGRSASIDLDSGKFNCFHCDTKGNAVKLVKEHFRLDWGDAYRRCQRNYAGQL